MLYHSEPVLFGDHCKVSLFCSTACNYVSFCNIELQEPLQSGKLARAGMSFLKAYVKLASLSHAANRRLFIYKPKAHYLHHIILLLLETSLADKKCWNPLAYSCSSAEDFIGRASMLSRRVAAKRCEFRVLQRYLAGVLHMLESQPEKSA